MIANFEKAWSTREAQGSLGERVEHRAVRLWYGPGEWRGGEARWSFLKHWAIDGYGPYLWMTEWESASPNTSEITSESVIQELALHSQKFFASLGYRGAVALRRPRQGVPELPRILWGEVSEGPFEVREGESRFVIRLLGSRHPGLFLDHRPLRDWLVQSGACRGQKVLNTFSYTGSLSVAAWRGGADQVTTLDLSKATLNWAKENAALNEIPLEKARWMAGDFFEELPRLKRRGERFGVVISDPPSFSRGKKGNFSTQKDLVKLHELLFSVLEPGGVLISSINSANVSARQFEQELQEAARVAGLRCKEIATIRQPETFPVYSGEPRSDYLKGLILRVAPQSQ